MRTYSGWGPSMREPRIQPPSLQCEYIPFLQNSHFPHAVTQEITTSSPLWKFETAFPTSSTTPTPSCPRTRPSVTAGRSPLRMWRSVPQIVDVLIRTMASVASLIVGLGLSSQARRPGPWKTRAFMVVFWVPVSTLSTRACDLLIVSRPFASGGGEFIDPSATLPQHLPQQRCRLTLAPPSTWTRAPAGFADLCGKACRCLVHALTLRSETPGLPLAEPSP